MRKLVLVIIFSLPILVANLSATNNQRDSLRTFLENIGEDSIIINRVMSSSDAADPLHIMDSYLALRRLQYDSIYEQLEWQIGWDDSVYVCKYVDYLTQRIVQDTALSLIEDYLENAYLLLFHHEYAVRRLLDCAEYSIVRFHSRSGYLIPELCYLEKETNDRQKKLQIYEMIKFVIFGSENVRNFDKEANKKINVIIAESNESSPYYVQFRTKLDSYSDMELARITNEQKEELASILRQGIVHGEKKTQLTYAFMLLTGQFVEKNEKYGKELLSRLLK